MALDPFNVENKYKPLGFGIAAFLMCLLLSYVIYLIVNAWSTPPPVNILQNTIWGPLPNLWFCAIQIRPDLFGEFSALNESFAQAGLILENGVAKYVPVRRDTFTLADLAAKNEGFGYFPNFKEIFQIDAARSNLSSVSDELDDVASYDFSRIPCAFIETSGVDLNPATQSGREVKVIFNASVPVLPLGGRVVAFAESVRPGYLPWVSQVARTFTVTSRGWMPQDVSVTKRIIEFQELAVASKKREIFTSAINSALPNFVFDSPRTRSSRLRDFPVPTEPAKIPDKLDVLHKLASLRKPEHYLRRLQPSSIDPARSVVETYGQSWLDNPTSVDMVVNFRYDPVIVQFHTNMWWNLLRVVTAAGQYFAFLGIMWTACFTHKLRDVRKLTLRGNELHDHFVIHHDSDSDKDDPSEKDSDEEGIDLEAY